MSTNLGWLAKATAATKPLYVAYITNAAAQENAIILDPDATIGTDEELKALPVWCRTATTNTAFHQSPTGAARLPKAIVADADLPRVTGWKKILKEIGQA